MDSTNRLLNVIMIVATIAMFAKNWLKGFDMFDLIFNNIYLLTVVLYLIRTNYLEDK